ncbi:hypothetical protein [Pseudoprimorskyibacter insulae]|uniref:Uncharacterized protein n=1 Tax=Pseudoprimorskyibacter insulae TaxID=1695997 RepID=A0A2R8B0Q2_9RHOB|nr:hypothetical protein [Pseudoprimorskyibacter insulae]SPF81797.1 hypothetical protein PRI8871_03622 [Pseudoprimorskyibacter insulae]
MSASQAQTPAISPAQSHEDIQKLLRAEIDALKDMLDARFAEIAKLTDQLETIDVSASSAANEEIEAIKRRHAVEITLLHARYASWANGPANGVPSFGRQIEILGESDLFNATWYLNTYPDVSESGMSPREHYVRSGGFEGRNPGPDFDSMSYYVANPDIAATGWPALVHYAAFGKTEGRPLS